MAPKKAATKRVPQAPMGGSKAVGAVAKNPLFEKTPRSYRVGGDILPRPDLTRFVRFPRYIRVQRQKRILLCRMKVPPAVAQFQHTLDKNQAAQLLKLSKKYQPETRTQKKERLMEEAKSRTAGAAKDASKKPVVLKYGLNHVTQLIENQKAKLVVIAHDVDPIEMVCWLPQLCRKKDVPYCIIKGKARLGQLVHKKTAACVAFTNVKKEDQSQFDTLVGNFRAMFNENTDVRRKWGGGDLGHKSKHIVARREKALHLEQQKKLNLGV